MSETAVAKTSPAPEPPQSPNKQGWWKSDSAEPVRRNLGLVGVLVILVIIGIVTKPGLYGDGTWVKQHLRDPQQPPRSAGHVGMTF